VTENDRQWTKKYVEHWKRAGPLLEQAKRDELAHYDYEQRRHIVEALLEIGVRFARPRTTSGLVELQRVFIQARARRQAGRRLRPEAGGRGPQGRQHHRRRPDKPRG
jgi:hypothetical protein